VIRRRIDDEAPQVRAAAAWAAREALEPEEAARLGAERLAVERDETVRAEWR
jgi:hypothetical protein